LPAAHARRLQTASGCDITVGPLAEVRARASQRLARATMAFVADKPGDEHSRLAVAGDTSWRGLGLVRHLVSAQ
jgi:hypothetical protein